MKILIVSDTHGYNGSMYEVIEKEAPFDMMIHCGDPIQYADLSGSYWQAHFYSYGRLPEP